MNYFRFPSELFALARRFQLALFTLALLGAGLSSPCLAQTAKESTVYAFTGNADSQTPASSLIQAGDGNLYGTTIGNFFTNFGIVFKVTPQGSLSPVYSFTGGTDGATPFAGVVEGSDGNFYGSTYGNLLTGTDGTIYQVTPAGADTTLYSFTGGSDGANPTAPFVQDPGGQFYGVSTNAGANGAGDIFTFTSSLNSFSVVEPFSKFNGYGPNSPLVLGTDGNYYGLATSGGSNNFGAVYQLTPSNTINVIYSFLGTGDGASPIGNLVEGSDGNFYGVTGATGVITAAQGGNGTVFKVTPAGVLTTLYLFTGGSDGGGPGGIFMGSDGNLYGTTGSGGANGDGVFFQVTPAAKFTVLYSFLGNSTDGGSPQAWPIQGSDGNFYGTADSAGANGDGTVYAVSLTPALAAPVQVSLSSATIALGQTVTVNWSVLNAFSKTMQQCYAQISGTTVGAGAWTGLQTGSYNATTLLYSGSAQVTPSAPGNYTYALVCGGQESGSVSLNVGNAPTLVVSSTTLPNGKLSVAYSTSLTASGGVAPYTWSVTSGSLPTGLALNATTGVISGTPTQNEIFNFVVQVKDSEATPVVATASLGITVVQNPVITTTSLPVVRIGEAYSATLVASAGTAPYTWSVLSGSLPTGLALASSTGAITGTPTATGTSSFTVKAVDSETVPQSATAALSITVNPLIVPTGVVTIDPATATTGQAVAISVTVSGPTGSPAATGTVQFLSNGVNIGSAVSLVNGVATLTGQTFSSSGEFAITANYSGDTNYEALDFAPANLLVIAPAMGASPSTLTVATPGGTATTTLTLSNFNSTAVTFNCSGLPANSSCSFGSLSSTGNSVLTISTSSTTTTSQSRLPFNDARTGITFAWAFPGMVALAGVFVFRRRNAVWRGLMVLIVGLSIGAMLTGCGGGNSSQTSQVAPAGTSTVTVSATAGSQTADVIVTLVIQ